MPDTLTDVTVIVPVFDDVEGLRGCLAALAGQDLPDLVQVVVVDNASTRDVSVAMPDDPRFVLLSESRKGSYAARNTGLGVATGGIVAFTDADCTPARTWLTRAVRELTREPVADMVGGRIRLTFPGGTPRRACELYEAVHGFPQSRYLADQRFAATANMVTWRRVFDQVGFFDASLRSRGDAEWGQRVAAAGGVQRYAEDAVVEHPARSTWAELMRKVRRVAHGRIEADRGRGMGARHFMGIAIWQLRSVVASVSGPLGDGSFELTRRQRARYLGALTACRATTASLMLAAAIRAAMPRTR